MMPFFHTSQPVAAGNTAADSPDNLPANLPTVSASLMQKPVQNKPENQPRNTALGGLAGMLAGMIGSAVLAGLYARGGAAFLLGFVMLVPWLCTLGARRTLSATLCCAWAMSVAFSAAVFAWFGIAIGKYTGAGAATGLAVLLLAAPLFQPQFFAYAVVRHWMQRRHGPLLCALAAAAAWVATEWLVPRLLGDTLGHGLYPSRLLRQGAEVGGAAGLTLILLLVNECIALIMVRCASGKGETGGTGGLRALCWPLALALLLPLVLALYGLRVLANDPASPAAASKPLRIGMVQSNIVDYERRRQQQGAYEAVRQLLDTHFAMSYDAVVRQHADAVLWSETSYPTTFAHPKSEAGFELDQSILGIVNAAGVPFVFGTYDRDDSGEYNAAAFVSPGSGLLGFYRKTRLFPFTEYVPGWLDSPLLRRALPWSGSWRAGNGARVFPLRLADGREIPVLPLICRDDVDTMLGIHGARLGAQVILTMSNDAWFTDSPQGAQLHQAVAAFRSIETRLPQFRVTTNGYSGLIDATGNVLTPTRMGQQTLVVGALPVGTPPRTLVVMWGNWVGQAALAFLALLGLMAAINVLIATPLWHKYGAANAGTEINIPLKVAVLPPAARIVASLLRIIALAGLLWLGWSILQSDALRGNTLAQIRLFTTLFLLPEVAAWCVLLAFSARTSIEHGALVLAQGTRRIEIALHEIKALEPWRLPLPCPGVAVRLSSGAHWHYALALGNPATLLSAVAGQGVAEGAIAPSRLALLARARQAIRRGWLDHPLARYCLLPLALALPAYYLHQHIAFGSGFGEYTAFGLKAYASGLALWWAAWVIGITLCGAALRVLIETATVLGVLLHPAQTEELRRWLERCGNVVLYLGVPGWLLLRIFGT